MTLHDWCQWCLSSLAKMYHSCSLSYTQSSIYSSYKGELPALIPLWTFVQLWRQWDTPGEEMHLPNLYRSASALSSKKYIYILLLYKIYIHPNLTFSHCSVHPVWYCPTSILGQIPLGHYIGRPVDHQNIRFGADKPSKKEKEKKKSKFYSLVVLFTSPLCACHFGCAWEHDACCVCHWPATTSSPSWS